MMKIVNLMLLYICYANAFIPSTNVLNKINVANSNICSSKKIIYNAVSLLRASIYNDNQKVKKIGKHRLAILQNKKKLLILLIKILKIYLMKTLY